MVFDRKTYMRKMRKYRKTAKCRRNLGFVPIMPMPNRLHETSLGKQHRMKSNKILNKLGFDVNSFSMGGD